MRPDSKQVIVTLLHDARTHRWHPVVFDSRPVLDSAQAMRGRLRSIAHHTAGFDTRQEALAATKHIADTLVNTGCASTCRLALDSDIEWRGENNPTMVMVRL